MKISIIDDHKLLSELLRSSLVKFDHIQSVNVYDDYQKFFSHLGVVKPDILIVDMLMPEINGVDLIKKCREILPAKELKILVLSTVINPNVVKEALKAGANGYVCKDVSIEELLKAIRFMQGDYSRAYIGESLKDILVQSQLFEDVKFKLSPREQELLVNICEGKTVKEISFDLELSVNTIQSYMKQLMRKMDVNRTPDLILKAIKFGLFYPRYTI